MQDAHRVPKLKSPEPCWNSLPRVSESDDDAMANEPRIFVVSQPDFLPRFIQVSLVCLALM